MTEDLTIRSYQEGDEARVNEMFNEVFGQHRDLAVWYWKYRDNPYGRYVISIAESRDGTVAAHYAGYPVRYSRFGEGPARSGEVLTYQIGDKMTRKSFRSVGRGRTSVLSRTVDHFCATFCAGKVPFYLGFLTHHSLRFGILFLNYTVIEPVPFRVLESDAFGSITRRRLPDWLSGVTVKETSVLDAGWTTLFEEAAPHYRYLARRDEPYLRWRYLERPDRKYLFLSAWKGGSVTGWAVFFREGDRILWGDALVHPQGTSCVRALLRALLLHPFAEGARRIECWFPPRPAWWDSLVREFHFQSEPEPQGLKFTTVLFTNHDTGSALRDTLYYTMGDSDLF